MDPISNEPLPGGGELVVENVPEDVLNEVEQQAPAGILVNKARRTLTIAGAGLAAGALAVRPVAANVTIDWTAIGEYFTGIASIMPGLGTLIGAIVGPIILLSIVAFLTGTLDEILNGIRGAFSKLGR